MIEGRRGSSRRLTLADLVILVAGSAAWMVVTRFSWDIRQTTFLTTTRMGLAFRLNMAIAPALLALAASLLAASMIPPRPRWRLYFRRPGTWACLGVLGHMTGVAISTSWHLLIAPAFHHKPVHPDFNGYLFLNSWAGGWVAVAWATLALSGAWRPQPDWIDRTGRLLGIVAIALSVASALLW